MDLDDKARKEQQEFIDTIRKLDNEREAVELEIERENKNRCYNKCTVLLILGSIGIFAGWYYHLN